MACLEDSFMTNFQCCLAWVHYDAKQGVSHPCLQLALNYINHDGFVLLYRYMSNTRMLSKTDPTFQVESIRTCQPLNAWLMSTTYRSISDAAWQDIFRADVVVACLDIPVSLEPAWIQFLLSRITADGAVREDLVVIPGVFRQWLHTALTTPRRISVLCRVWIRGNTGVDAQNLPDYIYTSL